jgi:hypothetical protein
VYICCLHPPNQKLVSHFPSVYMPLLGRRKLICVIFSPHIDSSDTDELTNSFIGASSEICTSQIVHCSVTFWTLPPSFLNLSSASLGSIVTKICDIVFMWYRISLKLSSDSFQSLNRRLPQEWYPFSVSTYCVIFYCCNIAGPPLWSSGQSSWLQIRRPGFDSRHYQIFWGGKKKKTVVGLERGPLSLVSTTEELLDRKVAAPV